MLSILPGLDGAEPVRVIRGFVVAIHDAAKATVFGNLTERGSCLLQYFLAVGEEEQGCIGM